MNVSPLFRVSSLALVMAFPGALLAADSPVLGDYQTKDFLTDYSKLEPKADEKGTFEFIDSSTDFSKYNKLVVDRIKIFFAEDSDYKGIDPDELKMLTDYFYSAIEKAVGDTYPMVSEVGPDVMRLRIALTDVVPNKVEASVTTLIVPFLWIGDAGTGVAKDEAGSTAFTGEATIEAEALDSDSSTQVAAFVETRVGKKYVWTEGVEKGVTSYADAYQKWEYTKKAMDHWAELLRQRLDQAHGKSG